jgi:hypothetical protein
MQDPRMTSALQEFQKDANAAMKKYKDDHEIKSFLLENCSVLGRHFEKVRLIVRALIA